MRTSKRTHPDPCEERRRYPWQRYVQAVASLDDVVEEILSVLDVDAAFEAAGPVRKTAYRRGDPQVAGALLATPRLALREQLIEIKMIARV